MLLLILVIFAGAAASEWWEVAGAALGVAALSLLLALFTGRSIEQAIVQFAITFVLGLVVGFVSYLISQALRRRADKPRGSGPFFGRKQDPKADVFD